MNTAVYTFLAVLVCAVVTFLLRLAPFALFSGKRGMPPSVQRLARKMPAAIIAVLVVYCMKGLPAGGLSNAGITLLSASSVVALHIWKKNTLLSIGGGTVLYMALLRLI